MKITLRTGERVLGNAMGFTLAEIMVAVGILATMVVTVFAGITLGWSVIHTSRDDLRATQILTQKLESIRLLNWSQLTMAPTNFTDSYNPNNTAGSGSGTVYNGTISIGTPTNFTGLSYQDQVKMVTVTVTWKSYFGPQSVTHSRSMQSLSAMNGMQNYIWGSHP
jgi:Tfp pilus assembly protein PilV